MKLFGRKSIAALSLSALLAGGFVVAAPASDASASTYPCYKNQTLRYGNVNSCVRSLQIYLNGYINARLVVDGSFGPATRSAVMEFQRRARITVDGSVGPQTREAIYLRTGIPPELGHSV